MAMAMTLSLLPPAAVAARLATRPRTTPRRAPSAPRRRNPNPKPLELQHSSSSSSSDAASTALECEHFKSCSGCSHEWNLDSPPVLEEVNRFFAELGVTDFTFDSGKLWEWRCRAKLAVRGESGNPLLGLYEEGTHNVVDIPLCKAHHPSINAAVALLRQGISMFGVQPYDEDSGTGDLRYVQMAVTTYDTSLPASERYRKGKVQISLVWNSRNEQSESAEKLNALSRFLWRNGGAASNFHLIHSVWANFQTSSGNVIFGNRWRHLLGEREFWEHVGGIDIFLDPSSFGQANTQLKGSSVENNPLSAWTLTRIRSSVEDYFIDLNKAFNSLLRKLQKYVPYGSSVVDLYAGAGIIGLSLAATRRCRSVKCVEINKESKVSFEKSLGRLSKGIDSSISWHNTDASIEPLHWLEGSDVVIVDPPRKGLDPSIIETLITVALSGRKMTKALGSSALKLKDEKRPWILRAREPSVHVDGNNVEKSEIWPQTLIYISCGWESFKKDCTTLLSSKTWYLEKVHGFNLFPGTQSIEVLAIFKHGPRISQSKKKGKKNKVK